jgi:signal peptidase
MRPLLQPLKAPARLLAAGFLASSLLLLLAVGVGPRTGRYQVVTVLTGSMRPGMPEGSVVLSVPTQVQHIRVGDVITYRIPAEDRRVVTHRVVEVVEPGTVRTKGDANAEPDPWLARLKGGQVSKAHADVPKVGYVLERLREPTTSRMLVWAVPFVLAVLWVRDIWSRTDDAEPATAPAVAVAPAASGLRSTVALAALLSLGAACARDRA